MAMIRHAIYSDQLLAKIFNNSCYVFIEFFPELIFNKCLSVFRGKYKMKINL